MTPRPKAAPKKVLTMVQRLLSRKFGDKVELDCGENLQPDAGWRQIYRFRLLERPDGLPASVVAKRRKDVSNIATEWACLQFLSEVMGEDAVAPQFYGGHGGKTTPLIVMEDMGDGRSLYDLLKGNDIDSARASLIDSARATGKVGARSIGRSAEFRRIISSLMPDSGQQQSNVSPADDLNQKFAEICNAAGIDPHPEASPQLQAVADFLDTQNRFHALNHGDLYPVNLFCSTETAKTYLFDYEYGYFQHAILDGFQIRLHLDLWAEASRFPDDMMLEMENTYRSSLAPGCPEAQDDSWFFQRLIEASINEAIYCIYRFGESPEAVFSNVLREQENSDYDALKTDNYNHWCLPAVRRRSFYRLGLLARLTEEHGYLEAVGATAGKIQDKYRSIWPPEVHEMPLYRVFR